MDSLYEQRSAEFGNAFQAEEIMEIEQLLVALGRLSERITLDPPAIDHAMKALFSRMTGRDLEAETAPWMEVWQKSVLDVSELRLSQLFTSLHAYGFYGLDPDTTAWTGTQSPSLSAIETVVRQGRDVLDAVPETWPRPEGMKRTVLAAEGRLALDAGRGLAIEQFAALAQINVRTAKNLLMPSSLHRLRVDADGLIPAAEALGWLEKRDDFRPSIWEQRGRYTRLEDPENGELTDEVFFLPVAKDGSWFDPATCCRNGDYTVGLKGEERTFKDFRAALAALAAMRTPRWRRPNDKGHWGIVRAEGERWLRRTARELALEPTKVKAADREATASP